MGFEVGGGDILEDGDGLKTSRKTIVEKKRDTNNQEKGRTSALEHEPRKAKIPTEQKRKPTERKATTTAKHLEVDNEHRRNQYQTTQD